MNSVVHSFTNKIIFKNKKNGVLCLEAVADIVFINSYTDFCLKLRIW
jgi:hypothetical protein